MSNQRPFHCGSQYMDWDAYNCERCAKAATEDELVGKPFVLWPCDIQASLLQAALDDGRVPEDVAERMGYLDNSPPRQIGWSYNWRCKEFESKKEANRDYFQLSRMDQFRA